MKETFYKNSLSGMQLVVSICMMVVCVLFGILYNGDSMVKIAVPVIGVVFTVIWMVTAYNKQEMYKKLRVTDDYIEVVSNFKIGFRIDFDKVECVGRLGLALTKASTEKFFISTMPLSRAGAIDLDNTLTFDATPKTKRIMKTLSDKYGWEIVEINN